MPRPKDPTQSGASNPSVDTHRTPADIESAAVPEKPEKATDPRSERLAEIAAKRQASEAAEIDLHAGQDSPPNAGEEIDPEEQARRNDPERRAIQDAVYAEATEGLEPGEEEGDDDIEDLLGEDEIVASEEESEQDPTQLVDREDGTPSDAEGELPVYLKNGVPTVKLKVNGEELEMEYSKVKGIVQKNLLAEVRLRAVNEQERVVEAERIRLEDLARVLAERERTLGDNLTKSHLPTGAETDAGAETRAKALVHSLFHGTEEEAVSAATEVLAQSGSPTAGLDPTALIAQAKTEAKNEVLSEINARDAVNAEARLTAELERGMGLVQKQYPKVLQDDFLFSLVDKRTEVLAEDHPGWSPSQVMVEAAREISEAMVSGATASGVDIPARKARKDKLKPVPLTRPGAKFSKQTEAEPDTSPESVIARMREDRMALSGSFVKR